MDYIQWEKKKFNYIKRYKNKDYNYYLNILKGSGDKIYNQSWESNL